MFGALARRIFGTANDRMIKSLLPIVAEINALEPTIAALSDEALKQQTVVLREKIASGTSLDDILPEAFATVREASKRVMGMRHFDTQMMGGIVLHQGRIAEMKTGEGKTLVATAPVYLNALAGKGVHVVTVNDYLARRDAEWMGRVYKFLGMSVGVIVPGIDDTDRREAYAADITYGTNNELGFDYLRDNMKFRLTDMVQRPFNFAIVDEVDSILIDEARTPLIISGPSEQSSNLYLAVDTLTLQITPEHYEKDEKAKTVSFTEDGTEVVENLLRDAGLLTEGNLYDVQNVTLVHHIQQALRAHTMFTRDVDYMIKDDKVILIDEFTGRMMDGRRYSDGLHQALEAKERVEIQPENQTLATITFQNYFRLYPKLAGMTGTAMTEAAEFSEIYKLEVIEMPTNRPFVRDDQNDEVYRTAAEKYTAIANLIEDCQKRGQPCLVGTTSIEKSEFLADLLRKTKGIEPKVLNARYHEQEAHIVAGAGEPGAVMIATNMAGRGTDIQLGGNLEMRIERELKDITDEAERATRIAAIKVDIEAKKQQALAAGGLFVIGTERHESRRIDNQLRGRSGRQGDPGASRFFLSLEDDLMRIFGMDRLDRILGMLGLKEGEAIVHKRIDKSLEVAQQRVEARNFDVRKNLLRFDDVMNAQRKVIYEQRRDVMNSTNLTEEIKDMLAEVVENTVAKSIPPKATPDLWDVEQLHNDVQRVFGVDLPVTSWIDEEGMSEDEADLRIFAAVEKKVDEKQAAYGDEIWHMIEKSLFLQILDHTWKEHLLHLDHLRQGINLRAYAQRDPLNEYKSEAFEMFQAMLGQFRERVIQTLAVVEIQTQAPDENELLQHGLTSTPLAADGAPGKRGRIPSDPSTWGRVSRNEACPCGSGKKYKQCHGVEA